METMKTFKATNKIKISTFLDRVARDRWIVPLVLIILYVTIFSAVPKYSAVFLSQYNLTAFALEFSLPALVVIGMAILLISAEIDLSVGYNVMFSSMICGMMVIRGVPVVLAILITLSTTALLGFIVGTLVARVGINSFIATLGMGQIYYSLALAFRSIGSDATKLAPGCGDLLHLPSFFTDIAQKTLFGFQIPVYISAIMLIVFSYLMARTRYFRKYYYVGMNKEAAKLSGINVESMKTVAFFLSAVITSLAGILYAARMASCSTSLGVGMETKAITAAVIGGISFKGGKGTMGGAVLGALFIICVSNGMRISEVPSNIYKIIEGGILLLAVILDAQFNKRKIIG